MRLFIFFLLISIATATPPSCFVECINSIAHICPQRQNDLACICNQSRSVMNCITDSCWGITYYSSRDHFAGTCVEHGFDFGVIEEHPHFTQLQSQRNNHIRQPNKVEPDFGQSKNSEINTGIERVTYAEKESYSEETVPYSAESQTSNTESDYEGQSREIELNDGNSSETLSTINSTEETHRDYSPEEENLHLDLSNGGNNDVREKKLKYEECIEYIPYKSGRIPVSAKYLERLKIPHLLFDDGDEDQNELISMTTSNCGMSQEERKKTGTGVDLSSAPAGHMVRITRKLEA